MSFSNCAEIMRYHFNHSWGSLGRSMSDYFSVLRREKTALAAQRGGDDSFGRNQAEVCEYFRVPRRDAVNLALGSARVLRDKMQKIATDALKIDPDQVAAIAPTLALGLNDAELARLAADHRDSLATLRAIGAQRDSAYARALRRALDDFSATVSALPEKCFVYVQRACSGQNDVSRTQSVDLLKSLIEERIADVDAAWSRLGDAIDGRTEQDPLRSALDTWAAAR